MCKGRPVSSTEKREEKSVIFNDIYSYVVQTKLLA